MESHIPVEGSASQALTSKLVIFISHHFVQYKCLTPLLVFTDKQNRASIYSSAAVMYYIDDFENVGVKMDWKLTCWQHTNSSFLNTLSPCCRHVNMECPSRR